MYDLASYYKELLIQIISSSPAHSFFFDELQDEQLDVQVCFWNNKSVQVETCYLDSQFFNWPNADIIINKIFNAMLKLFNDSLARTDLYIRLNRSDLFPLMFYQIRWVEEEPWQFIVTGVTQYLPLSNPKHPKNKSYDLLV